MSFMQLRTLEYVFPHLWHIIGIAIEIRDSWTVLECDIANRFHLTVNSYHPKLFAIGKRTIRNLFQKRMKSDFP